MFTTAQKVAIRRYCGFAMFGNQPVQAFGHRFYQHYGTLEYRLQHMLPEEEEQTVTFLTAIQNLEAALLGTSDNIDTAAAAVWDRNANEMTERTALYNKWRVELCAFIGIPPGPGLSAASGTIRLVV